MSKKLPAAVQKKIDDAKGRSEELTKVKEDEQAPPVEEPKPSEPAPIETTKDTFLQPAAPAITPPAGTMGTTPGTAVSGPPPVQTAPPQATPPQTPAPVTEETWEQKYRTLQNKYDKEVPRYARDSKTLQERLDKANARIVDLTEKVAKMPPPLTNQPTPPPSTPTAPTQTATPADLAQFEQDSPETYKLIQSMIQHNLKNSGIDNVQTKVDNLENVTTQNIMTSFYGALDTKVPDWKMVNTDPEFAEWLNQEDRYTPYTKMQLLQTAYSNFNVDKVAQFLNDFKDFKASQAPGTGTPQPQAAPQPALAPETMVAPTSSSRASDQQSTAASNKPTITQSAVNQFYKDKALRKLVLTPEQIAGKEQEILTAMMENRIVPG